MATAQALLLLLLAVGCLACANDNVAGACHGCDCSGSHVKPMDFFEELYKYYNAGDLKGVLSMMDDDAVIEWPSPVLAPFSGRYAE
jgi:hypothetical protein